MFDLFREMLSYPFMQRALLVGILVSLCAALLGVSLVLKRYSMIGDGLSHVGFGALAVADHVLRNEFEPFALLHDLDELILAHFAHRALLGCLGTFVDVPADGTTPFLCCHNFLF